MIVVSMIEALVQHPCDVWFEKDAILPNPPKKNTTAT